MDFSRAMGTELREVADVEHDGQPARAVQGSRFYSTDPADLWDALTNAERIPRWFLPIQGDLRLGGRYKLEGHAEGTISRCDPPEALDLSWECGGSTSWVRVRLVPENDGARLTLVHTMLKDEAGEAHWATYGPGATGVGWDLSFLGLGLHLENGGAHLDQDAVAAWMASNPGKAVVRACAEAWGRAHVENGEEVDVAQTMAAQTASAYLGE